MKSKSLQKNISEIKGVGPKIKEELNKIGINYIQDALFLLPKKYENRTKLTSIKDLTPGEAFQFEGEILESKTIFPGRRSFMARISDGTGFLQIRLFYFSFAQAKAFKVVCMLEAMVLLEPMALCFKCFIQAIKSLHHPNVLL